MKYYIIAGEASGDLHASNLIKELKKVDSNADFRCWGGDLMQQQGAHLVKHYRDLAFMGFTEVVANLGTIFKNIKLCKRDVVAYKPDALVLVDYPGFNMRIAEFAKKNGLRVFYYISPKIWAWNQGRVHKIKKVIDRMFVIFPFEKEFYDQFNYPVDFVGNPLLDAIEGMDTSKISFEEFTTENKLSGKPIIALLPGSRKQEVEKMLKMMLSVKSSYPSFQFVIAGAPSLSGEFYESFLQGQQVSLLSNKTYSLLQHATAALVTSGTATLETALFEVPQVVCYKAGKISYHIAKRLIKVKYISLVNLIMNREVVKELIQDELNTANLKQELDAVLLGGAKYDKVKSDYLSLKKMLGGKGASFNTAQLIFNDISLK